MLMWRSDFCDYSDACDVEKEKIDLLALALNENDKAKKVVAFKINAQFMSWISEMNSSLIDNAKDIDIVTPIYNLLEYQWDTIIQWDQKILGIFIETNLMTLVIIS